MNTKDLQAFTLVGPTRENLLFRPPALLSLVNRLFMNVSLTVVVLGVQQVQQLNVGGDTYLVPGVSQQRGGSG